MISIYSFDYDGGPTRSTLLAADRILLRLDIAVHRCFPVATPEACLLLVLSVQSHAGGEVDILGYHLPSLA
jgi:hypothetical protein